MTMQWWCLYFARVGVLFQGCVILSPSVVACPLHVNLGSRDERMASILSKNIDATNILSRVDICAEVSVGAILQDMPHDLGLSIVYMRHYPPYPDIPISIPISDGQTRETRRILPKGFQSVITPKGKGSYGLSLSFPRSLVKRGRTAGTPGLEWRISRSLYEAFWAYSRVSPGTQPALLERWSRDGWLLIC
jgi:hypothetical protein